MSGRRAAYLRVEVAMHGLEYESAAAVVELLEELIRSTFALDFTSDLDVELIESAGFPDLAGEA